MITLRMANIERYPLTWPTIYPRTPAQKLQKARFEVSFAKARDELLHELELLGAKTRIISSNIPLRKDGLPYANTKEPIDKGVAVYFQLNNKPYALACDRWDATKDNLRAIGLHVAAMRGMERWGVGNLEQAFAGYQALPASSNKSRNWWDVLGVKQNATPAEIKEAYKELVRRHHPDAGGTHAQMLEINWAYDMAKASRI